MEGQLSARKLAITIYENHLNTTPIKELNTSIDKLAAFLEKRTVRSGKLGHRAFSPYKLITGKQRHNSSVEFFSMAVADIDDGSPLSYLKSSIADYTWIAYSSHSHTNDEPRYRLILPLTRDVSVEEWPRFWKGFSAFLQGHVDPATKDKSRLFFLPSCPEDTLDQAFYEYHQGGKFLDPDPIIASVPRGLPVSNQSKAKNNAFAAAVEYPNSYAEVVAKHCKTIAWFADTGAPEEPVWHKCVGVLKHCIDGTEKIHEWSAKYDGYDYSETQRKIDAWEAGPTTCEVMRGVSSLCSGCDKQCKTPVQLGHIIESKPVDLDKIVEVDPPVSEETKQELINSIWHPKVSDINGELHFAVKDENTDEIKHKMFCKTVVYATELVKNEEDEWEMVVEYITPYGAKRTFRMLTSTLSSADKMTSALAAHTIFTEGKEGRTFMTEHFKSMVLGLKTKRKEIITEESFGWTKDGEGFIIGNTMVTTEGDRAALLSDHIKRGGLAKDFGTSGTRNKWVQLVDEVYNRPGAELYQFAFLVSAASPLIEMVGIDGFHGIPVAYTGDGGRGKTTACELACSIWGKGESFKQSSNKGGNTILTLLAKTAIFKNLPWVMDELTGQKTDEIADMLYALSNGQNKGRMGANGTFAGSIMHWDLFSFITGNMDITGLLANIDRQQAEAVSVRCFEVKVPADLNETVFKDVNFKTKVDIELRNNYGVVGRELLRVYMKNRAKIVALVHKLRQDYQPRTADETRERYYVDLICFALAAGRVMQKKDLIRFDLEAVKKWAFSNVKALRRARTERQMTTNDLIGDFLNSLHYNTIVTKKIVDLRVFNATPEVPLEVMRGEPLARKVTGERRFFISAKAMQVYGKENNIAPSVIRESLDRAGYIQHVEGKSDKTGAYNMRLGQGTTMTTGLARCYELDYNKIHGLETKYEGDNVVPIHREVAQAEPVKEDSVAA